jgi:hypothetical protein
MENKEILTESISELSKNNFDTSLISDNKLCFVVEETLYRVRMPNQGEQSLTEHKRNLMQLEYLKQEGCITKNQLIAQLKNSGVVDIEQLEETRENLTKELKKFWFMLATKDSEDKNKIAEYSETIGKIQEKLQNLAMDIATYLSPCLESRLEKFYIEFVTSICTEQRIGEEWKRVWNSFDEFNNADTTISNKALANFTWLLLNKR